jgi:hypothetical protein
MAVFIELTTDAFEDNLNKQARRKRGKDNRSGRAGRRIARRPMRGIEIKDDTYAMIKVIDAAGQAIPLVDSSSPDGNTHSGYANFLLQSVNETRIEKQQIVETFGDAYIFFFGESPRFVDVNAVLLNTHDFNWRAEWWQNYNDLLRGTRLVENGARVYLFYDDIILEGYLLQAGVIETAQDPYKAVLQFKMFITNYSNISLVGNPNFPIRSSVVLPHDVSLTEGDASLRLISRYRDGGWDSNSIDAFDNQAGGMQEANQGGTNDDGSASFSEQFGPFEASGGASAGAGQAQAGVAFGTSGSQPKSGANPLARKVSDAFRNVPRSFAVSQDVWTFLFSATEAVEDIAKLVIRAGKPIRTSMSTLVCPRVRHETSSGCRRRARLSSRSRGLFENSRR